MSNHNKGRFGGRGYYIALILCAFVIGVTSYVYYRNTGKMPPDPDTPVLATAPTSLNRETKPGIPEREAQPTDPEKATEPTVKKMSVCMPVDGEILSGFAMEVLSYNQTTRDWRVHNGVDIGGEAGAKVVAAAEGEVYTVYDDDRMGMTVVIRHEGGYVTKYSSLASEVSVSPGDWVEMGQTIGCVGSTALMENALGDHVHFSVTKNDEPVDPETFLNQ